MVGELWRPAGGAYNVDGVLRIMVRGLEEELDARMSGTKVYAASQKRPSLAVDTTNSDPSPSNDSSSPVKDPEALPVLQQGVDLGFVARVTKRVGRWLADKSSANDANDR